MYICTARSTVVLALKDFLSSDSHFVYILKLSQIDFGGARTSHDFDINAEVVKSQSFSDIAALSFCK